MNHFDSDAKALQEAGQQAGAYVKQLAGATNSVLADIKL
jgi:hypothetical protein